MKALKITFIVLGLVVVLIFIVFGIYLLTNRQGVVTPFEVNTPEATTHLLIASQGSDFKNEVVGGLTRYFEGKPVYLRMIDVSGLTEIEEDDWDALVLIHTTEGWKLQPDVKEYLDRTQDHGKVVLLTTSGSGEWRPELQGIDILTSASKKSEVKPVTDALIQRLTTILVPASGDEEATPADLE